MWNCADFVVGMRGNSHRKSFCFLFSSSYFTLEKNSSNHVGHAFRLFKSGSWFFFFFFPTHIMSIYDSETSMSLSNTGWLSACFGSRSCYLHKDCPPCMGRRYHIRSRFAGHMQTLKKKKNKMSCSLLFVHSSGIFKSTFTSFELASHIFTFLFLKSLGGQQSLSWQPTNLCDVCRIYLFWLLVKKKIRCVQGVGID